MSHAPNHNETLVRATGQTPSLKVKNHVKAGRLIDKLPNHNETLLQDTPRKHS